jgi:hypothetical protein
MAEHRFRKAGVVSSNLTFGYPSLQYEGIDTPASRGPKPLLFAERAGLPPPAGRFNQRFSNRTSPFPDITSTDFVPVHLQAPVGLNQW